MDWDLVLFSFHDTCSLSFALTKHYRYNHQLECSVDRETHMKAFQHHQPSCVSLETSDSDHKVIWRMFTDWINQVRNRINSHPWPYNHLFLQLVVSALTCSALHTARSLVSIRLTIPIMFFSQSEWWCVCIPFLSPVCGSPPFLHQCIPSCCQKQPTVVVKSLHTLVKNMYVMAVQRFQ